MKTALAKVSEDLRSGAGVALSYSVSHIPCLSQALHIHLPFIVCHILQIQWRINLLS